MILLSIWKSPSSLLLSYDYLVPLGLQGAMYPKVQRRGIVDTIRTIAQIPLYDDTDKGNFGIVQILKWANQDSVLISVCVLSCNVEYSQRTPKS